MVDQFELIVANVVVNRFGHADGDQVESSFGGQLGDPVGGVHTVIAAVVEKITYVMRFEYLDNAHEIFLLMRFEFVSTRADGTSSRCRAQQGDLFRGLHA